MVKRKRAVSPANPASPAGVPTPVTVKHTTKSGKVVEKIEWALENIEPYLVGIIIHWALNRLVGGSRLGKRILDCNKVEMRLVISGAKSYHPAGEFPFACRKTRRN